MSKPKPKIRGVVAHHERELTELRADRGLAMQYLKAAMESLDDPDDRAGGLLALRTVIRVNSRKENLRTLNGVDCRTRRLTVLFSEHRIASFCGQFQRRIEQKLFKEHQIRFVKSDFT